METLYDDSANPIAMVFYGSAQLTRTELDETFGPVISTAHLSIVPSPGTMQVYRVDGLVGVVDSPDTEITAVVSRKITQYTRKSRYESMEYHTSGIVFKDLPCLVGALDDSEMRFFCARGMRAAIAPKAGPWEVMCKGCIHELECMMNAPDLAL